MDRLERSGARPGPAGVAFPLAEFICHGGHCAHGGVALPRFPTPRSSEGGLFCLVRAVDSDTSGRSNATVPVVSATAIGWGRAEEGGMITSL